MGHLLLVRYYTGRWGCSASTELTEPLGNKRETVTKPSAAAFVSGSGRTEEPTAPGEAVTGEWPLPWGQRRGT